MVLKNLHLVDSSLTSFIINCPGVKNIRDSEVKERSETG